MLHHAVSRFAQKKNSVYKKVWSVKTVQGA